MMLRGKTALITGGTSGIGFVTARLFLANGARVAITGSNPAKLSEARSALGGDIITICADVQSRGDLARMREELEAAFGSLNICFANAGVAFQTPIDEVMFNKLMDVNVKGVFFSVQAVLPIMPPGSSIILSTSWLNQVGTPGRSLLSASKAAVRSFARTLSAELLDRGIRVNAVSPGSIDTPIHRKNVASEADFAAYKRRMGEQVPVGRMGEPEDVAAAVLFLASDNSNYMLGAEIVIDGGRAEL
jgi:NAD(P)-dependent dehydrogenase (short-subunit alcohol dehydrogenase family)